MRHRLTIATRMAETADALAARVRSTRKGLFREQSKTSALGEAGIDPMLLALAMELALKAWITLDQGTKKIREHDLAKLFGMLQPEHQEIIEREFQRANPWFNPSQWDPLGKNVASILDHHANAFVKWRYMHEMDYGNFSLSEMEYVLETILILFRARLQTH